MFVKLIKYCRGYVKIKVSGFSPERFMNLCSNRHILIWQVNRCCESYEMYLSVRDYRCLRPILKKTKTKAVIIEKYGLPFVLHRYQKRKLFPAGVLFCIIFLFVMSLFLWEIRIEGNVYRTDDVIEDYLEELKIVPGILKSSIACEQIEKGLRERFDDITWTSAKIDGTCLEIQIKENAVPQATETELKTCDLVAEKAGTIVEIITRSGVPLCSKDMKVQKGDVLVSGVIPIKDDGDNVIDYRYVAADADIRMKTVYRYRDTFPMRNLYKEYTQKERKSIYIASAQDIWYLPAMRNRYQLYDTCITEYQIPVFKDMYLPFSVGVRCDREYYETSKIYKEAAAYALAEKRLQKYCDDLVEKGVQIITNSVKIEFVGDACQAAGNIQVVEDAGVERAVFVKTEDNK